MHTISMTELRSHLQKYISGAAQGDEIWVSSHGKVLARIVPLIDTRQEAKKKLRALRRHCKVGDVVSPLEGTWEVEQ